MCAAGGSIDCDMLSLDAPGDGGERLCAMLDSDTVNLETYMKTSLKEVGFVPRDSYDDFITRFKRLIGRSLAEKRDVRLLHKLLQIYESRIADLEKCISDEETKRDIF